MKKLAVSVIAFLFLFSAAAVASAADNPLADQEKAVHKEFSAAIPADRLVDVFKLHEAWTKAMADPEYRKKVYFLDVRTHPEFYAFHIRGTDHVHAGHMYTLPKKITDPNAEIYVFCRTAHRAQYVAGFLYKYGYKNVYCIVDGTKDGKKYEGGVVGWAMAGFPFVNQFTGEFVITGYSKELKETGEYNLREFHPY
ncbi:rhodanese-like domain-containing protein [Desulfatiglans anilini]|uniref:rhodanese-like domain-containing protein n=1 Tax=Desulfatiglans anilini TaxID=90728 RepID=UPI0004884725|nr:rhodanese-like domain-containing protein [Desulfatiglans anilini]